LDEQLAAEIADHLSAAASDLVRRGEAEEQAARLALARFGDVARVKRRCWWIHNGEEVMFRTAGIALLSILTIGVAVVGFGGWQLQRSLASRTEELSEQLASLTATQQAMLDQQRPPEITGLAYLGDPSKPAKDVEIQVFRFSEEPPSSPRASGVITRRLHTDSRGHFDSGILQSGEYCLLGPLLDPEGKVDEHELIFSQLQSGPLYLTAGVGKSTVELDLAASGRIRLAVANIPNSVAIADEEVRVLVQMTASTEEVRRYFERKPVPPSDEPPRGGWPLPLPKPPNDIAAPASQRPADLPRAWWLPPRDYSVMLNLSLLRTKKQGSQPGPFSVSTKWVTSVLKLIPGGTAVITVGVLGDPLEHRVEAAVKEFEKNSQTKLDIGSDISPILKSVADGIELNVALAMEETAVAR
jgi:cytochrome c-type biogenesis protein CcmH/NrfF